MNNFLLKFIKFSFLVVTLGAIQQLTPVWTKNQLSRNLLENQIDVLDYKLPVDGTDIGPAINRVCRLAEDINSKISVIKLNRGTYTLSTPIDLPMATTTGLPAFIEIDFRGVVFNAPGITAIRRIPTSNTNANNVITKLVPRIRGCEVKNATVGFDIGGCYGARLDECVASDCATGFRGTFLLNSEFTNCYAAGSTDYSFHLRSANGVWAGGSVANSSSNVSKLIACRSWMNDMDGIQFAVEASDSVVLEGCISEGNLCKYEVFFDAQGSTVVKQFYIEKHHCECGNPDTLFRLILRDQTVSIDGVDRGALPARFIDLTGSSTSRINIRNWHYLSAWQRTAWSAGAYAAGTRRKHNDHQWTALTTVSAADVPGVSANWRDDGFEGAFISPSVELGGQMVCELYDFTTLFNTAAWRCNGVNTLPKQLSNIYFDSVGMVVRSADGLTVNANREVILDSDIDNIYNVTPGTVRVNGTILTVP